MDTIAMSKSVVEAIPITDQVIAMVIISIEQLQVSAVDCSLQRLRLLQLMSLLS